jgi:transcriptional regulator with XRE-family HTH domain
MIEIADLVNDLFATYRKPNNEEYSNVEVARAMEGSTDASYLSKLRNRKIKNPGRETLLGLCQFFGVPASYFFPELDVTPSAERNPNTLHAALRSTELSPSVQEKLADLIRAMQSSQDQGDKQE